MLIYNFKKEFLGIDEKDLKTLGFKDLAGLRTEVADFADLFVKTPGYVHNFKHVHWIDFITCAESSEESKVIININNKNYKCVLQISTTFLIDNPSAKAYIVNLNNLRELSASESERISGDITNRELPQNKVTPTQIFNTPELSDEFDTDNIEEELQVTPNIKEDPYETPIEIDLETPDPDFEEEISTLDLEINENLNIDDLSLDIEFEDDLSGTLEVEPQEVTTTEVQTHKENFENGYVYNPKVASEELGLPLDLIEEFIQDFIEQAKEFKENLYKAVDEHDLDNLRILSHKLKGVAANLRVEDALETLTTINTLENITEIEENLDTFYKIISKLAGEEISVTKEVEVTKNLEEPAVEITKADLEPEKTNQAPQEDMLDISFKDDNEEDLYADPIETVQKVPEDSDERLTLLEPTVEPRIVYSKELIANEIGIDLQSFNELFDDYIQESTQLHKFIQDALNNDDIETCKNSALKLKGMGDNMRLTSLSDELTNIIQANSTQEIQESLNKIVTATAELSN
ncbi:MAG: Hpt domain-containing protein [Sulfurimonas sp.]|nr:Hpt domain-containing protein [Sulfurimonas sp.]